jgi:hypothetical protein
VCRWRIIAGMKTATQPKLAVIGRSHTGQPSTFRLQRAKAATSRNAAYRRLAATLLGVDVRCLAIELASKRMLSRGATAA